MTIDITIEKLIKFRIAIRENFPVRICYETGYRMANKGVLLPNGERLKLETVVINTQLYTSAEAIQRFIAAQNVTPESAKKEAKQSQSKRSATARKQLEKLGV